MPGANEIEQTALLRQLRGEQTISAFARTLELPQATVWYLCNGTKRLGLRSYLALVRRFPEAREALEQMAGIDPVLVGAGEERR